MSDGNTPVRQGALPNAHPLTTLLAVGWGLLASYQLLMALLITHSVRFLLVTPLVLVMVWATLERKRWGRLALLGISVTALAGYAVGAEVAHAVGAEEGQAALALVSDSNPVAVLSLLLAACTAIWMCMPAVVREFEQGKRPVLRAGQRGIAVALVAVWGLTLMLPAPAMSRQRHKGYPIQSTLSCRLHGGDYWNVNSRNVRSVARHNRR